MITSAAQELVNFTLNSKLHLAHKADKSVVTDCDKAIDKKLSQLATEAGLHVVSEEGEHVKDIVESGNYITIDPIDGTLGYIEYVNAALGAKSLNTFLEQDRGAICDFCLLLGIVENGIPQYGACYNYVTKETILIDGNHSNNLIRENNVRNYHQEYAVYIDQRLGDAIENKLLSLPCASANRQAALGLKSIYTILNPHISAITVHRVQKAGLWDILPAAVAARAFGGQIYDDKGEALKLTEYVMLPGNGATIIKGTAFSFVIEWLKQ